MGNLLRGQKAGNSIYILRAGDKYFLILIGGTENVK
jgi:hypothetical protein